MTHAEKECMNSFKAKLIKAIEFVSLDGTSKKLEVGHDVIVSSLESLRCTDHAGAPALLGKGLIGSVGSDSFDLCSSEFAYLN